MADTGTALLTPTDLMTLPLPERAHHFELSEGELITVGNAGMRHETIKSRVLMALMLWMAKANSGRVHSEMMFQLREHTARIPDVSVLFSAKLALLAEEDVPAPFGPDLAVEIISASESAFDAEKKVKEYFSADVQEVWQVYPAERFVRVCRSGMIRDYTENETLTSALLPGFAAMVRNFFAD